MMGHTWSCPICMKMFRRESYSMLGDRHATEKSRNEARTELQWDAINHLAVHVSDSLNGTKIEVKD